MVVIFIAFLALILTVFFCIVAIAATLLESLIIYSPLISLWIVFNTGFIIQAIIAIISKIRTKKFGKGNIIRTIIFGIIAFILFVVLAVLIFLKNFQTWKELYSAWIS